MMGGSGAEADGIQPLSSPGLASQRSRSQGGGDTKLTAAAKGQYWLEGRPGCCHRVANIRDRDVQGGGAGPAWHSAGLGTQAPSIL